MSVALFSVVLTVPAHSEKMAARIVEQARGMFAESASVIVPNDLAAAAARAAALAAPPPALGDDEIEIAPGVRVTVGETVARDRLSGNVFRLVGFAAGKLGLQQINPATRENVGVAFECGVADFTEFYKISTPDGTAGGPTQEKAAAPVDSD